MNDKPYINEDIKRTFTLESYLLEGDYSKRVRDTLKSIAKQGPISIIEVVDGHNIDVWVKQSKPVNNSFDFLHRTKLVENYKVVTVNTLTGEITNECEKTKTIDFPTNGIIQL